MYILSYHKSIFPNFESNLPLKILRTFSWQVAHSWRKKISIHQIFFFTQKGKTRPLQKFIFPFWSKLHTIQNTFHQALWKLNEAFGKCASNITSTILKIWHVILMYSLYKDQYQVPRLDISGQSCIFRMQLMRMIFWMYERWQNIHLKFSKL